MRIILVLAFAGCVAPEVGAPPAERCVSADSDPAQRVSYTGDIVPLFARCVQCHSPAGQTAGGLDLTTYDGLRTGGERYRDGVVVEGQPCASGLVDKLGPAPMLGGRMPASGPPFFSDAERQLVADWIFEGADPR